MISVDDCKNKRNIMIKVETYVKGLKTFSHKKINFKTLAYCIINVHH